MNITLILLFLVLGINEGFSKNDIVKSTSVKNKMHAILNSYVELVPYVYNGEPLEGAVFLKKLDNFEKLLKDSTHEAFLNKANLNPNLKIIRESVNFYKASVQKKNYYFARRGLKTIAAKCVTCHAQLPSSTYGRISGQYMETFEKTIKESYDQAMMAYLLRDYDLAIKKFTKSVKENKNDAQVQDRSIRKILKIAYMNNVNKDEILKLLESFKREVPKPSYLEENINKWIVQINNFNPPVDNMKKNDSPEKHVQLILNPVEDEISLGDPSEQMIPLFYMQGVLSRYLTAGKNKKHTAMSLYWLGLIENSFHEDFMFSLGDMYLKKCIQEYSMSVYAKKCYTALENSYTLGFTGSGGTDIPPDISAELKRLKTFLK